MAGYTQEFQQTVLDWAHPVTGNGDHIAYSADGTSETDVVARTPIGATGWAAATAASPSVKANSEALTSAAATGEATITHFAVYSALTEGVQKTEWTALDAAKTVTTSDQLTWSVGAARITLD